MVRQQCSGRFKHFVRKLEPFFEGVIKEIKKFHYMVQGDLACRMRSYVGLSAQAIPHYFHGSVFLGEGTVPCEFYWLMVFS